MALRQLSLATSFGQLAVAGGSRAGEGTLILLPQLRLALDAGRTHRALPAMSTVVVSHGHSDHLAGLAYWAGQRALSSLGPGTVLTPHAIAGDVAELLRLHGRLEGDLAYDVAVRGVDRGARRAPPPPQAGGGGPPPPRAPPPPGGGGARRGGRAPGRGGARPRGGPRFHPCRFRRASG